METNFDIYLKVYDKKSGEFRYQFRFGVVSRISKAEKFRKQFNENNPKVQAMLDVREYDATNFYQILNETSNGTENNLQNY